MMAEKMLHDTQSPKKSNDLRCQNLLSRHHRFSRVPRFAGPLFLLFLALLVPSSGLVQSSVILVGSGSSVPVPLYRRWSEEFNKRRPDIQVQYVALGTGEGIRQISK